MTDKELVISNKKHGDWLGDIVYYPQWKQYVVDINGLIFSCECLDDISNKLKECNQQKKLLE